MNITYSAAVLAMICPTLLTSCVILASSAIRSASSEIDEAASAEPAADTASPDTVDRPAYRFQFPGNWNVPEDFDPDHHIFISTAKRHGSISFSVTDEEMEVAKGELERRVAKMTAAGYVQQKAFSTWGKYQGYGAVISGKAFPSMFHGFESVTRRVFAFSAGRRTYSFDEVIPDRDRELAGPGFRLVEETFSIETCASGSRRNCLRGPQIALASISAGEYHACRLESNGTIVCWGVNNHGQAKARFGTFVSISAGFWHSCGLRNDSTIACWGDNSSAQATPPAAEFVSVSTGQHHTCGLKSDGTIACWGYDHEGQATPLVGKFAAVSAGGAHTCGLRSDGSVACWGDNTSGAAKAPAGTFVAVSAGGSFTCGVKVDGNVVCWGNSEYGQTTPPAM